MKLLFHIRVVLALLPLVAAAQAPPCLKFGEGTVYVTGVVSSSAAVKVVEASWQEILSVYTNEAFVRSMNQPIAGNYTWHGDTLTFQPTYPFASGAIYHAVFSGEALLRIAGVKDESLAKSKLELTFDIPQEKFLQTSIESVYPQSAVVPENLLRMYICFSGPMMPGEAYDHISLVNEKGERIEKAFLIVDQELWDAERKRLTILFDPGRIKRGLKANLDLGPPLAEGKRFYLVVDSTWRDINGNALQHSFTKTLLVTPPQRTKLNLNRLKTIAPLAATQEPLIIFFDRPMDHALVSKYISINDALASTVGGVFELTDDRTLKFIPTHPWQAGTYTVTISPLLEDVAGNNFNNAFDLDLSRDTRVNSTEALKLTVSIMSSAR